MIEFETKPRERWIKRTVNPDVIADAILGEEKLTLFYTVNKRGVASEYLNREQTKPSLEEIWDQINGQPKMISFEYVGLKNPELNGKVHLESSVIKCFKQTDQGIAIFFDRSKVTDDDLGIREGETSESLDDIWEQLCDAKGVDSEVKQ